MISEQKCEGMSEYGEMSLVLILSWDLLTIRMKQNDVSSVLRHLKMFYSIVYII